MNSPSKVFLVELDRSPFQMLQIEHISGHTLRPLDNLISISVLRSFDLVPRKRATRLRNAIVRTSLIQSENRSRRCVPISHLGSDKVSDFAILTASLSSWSPTGFISWHNSLFVSSFSQ